MKNNSAKPKIKFIPILVIVIFTVAIFANSYFLQKPKDIKTGSAAVANQPLHIENNLVVYPDGTRFIVKGANVEAYRDYDGGCGGYTDILLSPNTMNEPAQLMPMINKMKSVGINAVRLNYSYEFLTGTYSQNFNNYMKIAETFANNGIYVMISDHSLTGSDLSKRANAYPTFQSIIEAFRSRGIEDYLIVNPFNEPANFSGWWSEWETANKDILSYLRNNLNYSGLVFLDTIEWGSETNESVYQSITDYDASLLGGTPNVGFSNHWYPKNDPVEQAKKVAAVNNTIENTSKNYPLIIGELGQYNANTPNPVFVTDVLNALISKGLPNGHNGVFAWIWAWCDSNKMTDPWNDFTKLTSYGQLYVDNYYSKIALPTSVTSPSVTNTPTPNPTVSPTTNIPGDSNGDGVVDIIDFQLLSNSYGLQSGQSGYDSRCDFNGDNVVDILDFQILSNNFGRSK